MSIKSLGSKVLKVKADGRSIQMETLTSTGMTREELKLKAQSISNTLKKKGWDGMMKVSIVYDNLGGKQRDGSWTQVGDNVDLFVPYDGTKEPDKFTKFYIFYLRNPPKEGGNDDKYNDCFYNSLKELINDKCPWKTAYEFKKFLKLRRADKVSMEHMPKIDKALKHFKLLITGDQTYVSTKTCVPELHLTLLSGHFEAKKTNMIVHGISYSEKVPLLYHKTKTEYKCCDGEKLFTLNKTDFGKMKKTYKYVLVPIDDLRRQDIERNEDKSINLMAEHKTFVESAKELKKATNGEINLFKTGKFTTAALNYFDKYHKYLNPEPIYPDEAEWLESSSMGGVIRAKPYEGKIYKYDFVSFYGYIMANPHMLYPIKRGEFKVLTKEEFDNKASLPYGVYRCEITNTNNDIFVSHKNGNFYTHLDVVLAKELKYTVKLIEDGQPNALIYTLDKLIRGSYLFGDYVDKFFTLKKNKIKYAKNMLTVLWGSLSQTSLLYLYINKKTTIKNIPAGNHIVTINVLGDEDYEVKYANNEALYETNYARIKPFLIGKGRAIMTRVLNTLQPDTVKKVHIDSIFSTVEIKENDLIKIGNELGNLKYEGYSDKCKIVNCIEFSPKRKEDWIL